MSEREQPAAPIGEAGPPADVEEALRRAREHGQRAAAELAAALAALLDAGTLAARGRLAEDTPLGPVQQGLLEIRRRIEPDQVRDGASLLEAVAQALDAEITRWEERSRQDPNGRAVLRAFLGVRELLWELGVRPGDASAAPGSPTDGREGERKPPPPRVQRVSVEG